MAKQKTSTTGLITISGYIILPSQDAQSKQEDVSDSEDEEEDERIEFLDMKEMDSVSSGGTMFKSAALAQKEVHIMAGDKTYLVEGRFPLCDPWWDVTCRVSPEGHKTRVKSSSYKLRSELGPDARPLVSLFLAACGVQPNFVKAFLDWLPADQCVEPGNVLDSLQDFEKSRPENEAVAREITSRVNLSDAGRHVRVTQMFPAVMRYLPTLLPTRFLTIINSEVKSESAKDTQKSQDNSGEHSDLLEKLEKLIATDVWKFGFNHIMFKEFHLIRLEAPMEAFQFCGLFERIPVLQQDALLLYSKLKHHCRTTGSTYVEREVLVQMVQKEMDDERAWTALDFLVKQGVLMKKLRKLQLRNFYTYENGIAECLRSLIEGEPWDIQLDVREVLRQAQMERLKAKADDHHLNGSDLASETSEKPDFASGSSIPDLESIAGDTASMNLDPVRIDLDPDQVQAAEMICAHPVTVISGKGGCGKTTVVSLVFKAAVEKLTEERGEVLMASQAFQMDSEGSKGEKVVDCEEEGNEEKANENAGSPVEVLLTAPTGRAASLLSRKTCFTAYTMHQVIWSFMSAKKNGSGGPEDWKFSHVRVLVVDEGSLVSVQILHSILSMLTQHAQLQKFIILGDVRQLPSIEPGNTLCDLFEGIRRVHWSLEMKTNHRAESELIVRNAGLISEMGQKKRFSNLEFDAIIDIRKPGRVSSDKRFIFIQIWDQENSDLQDAIKFLLNEAPGLKDDQSSQFVAFKRKDCEMINHLCCKHYSDHLSINHKNKFNFQRGDKVCCTKNGYITEETQENLSSQNIQEPEKERKERLCNGEIFFIREDVTKESERSRKVRYLTLDDGSGRVLSADFRLLQRECKLRHAWARTIHTFQGSEAETIVYVLGNSSAQNWQHVYTAVTRGQKRVYVVGTEAEVIRTITKAIIPRKTQLCSLIKSVVAQPSSRDSLTPPAFCPFLPTAASQLSQLTGSRHHHEEEAGRDQAFHEDLTFSQTYAWSPMAASEETSEMLDGVKDRLSNLNEDVDLSSAPRSSDEAHRSSKRSLPDAYSTPSKLPKQTSSEDSPLGTSRLNLLSISSPRFKSNRQLFQEHAVSHGNQN